MTVFGNTMLVIAALLYLILLFDSYGRPMPVGALSHQQARGDQASECHQSDDVAEKKVVGREEEGAPGSLQGCDRHRCAESYHHRYPDCRQPAKASVRRGIATSDQTGLQQEQDDPPEKHQGMQVVNQRYFKR